MYTLSFRRSHLGIVAVVLLHQEYPSVMLDPCAINKLAGYVSPGVRADSEPNSTRIRPESALFFRIFGRNPRGIRPDSVRNPVNYF